MAAVGVGEAILSDQSSKPRRPKLRGVSSRYALPTSTLSLEISSIPSPNRPSLSPLRQKPRVSADSRMPRSLEDSGFISGLWPSSSSPSQKKLEHLIEPQFDKKLDSTMFLNRQRSCVEFDRSTRYTRKFMFLRRSSTSSSSSSSSSSKSSFFVDDNSVPGSFSVDETALHRKSSPRRKSDCSLDTQDSVAGSDGREIHSGNSFGSPVIGKNIPASYMAPTVSSRKGGTEVSSKYMQSRRCSSVPNSPNAVSSDNHAPENSTLKTMIKGPNSLTTYGNSSSRWALSPGRSGSPPMSIENKGRPTSFSSFKLPTSPIRAKKGMGNLITMGLDLLKGKKSSFDKVSSRVGPGTGENVGQLRLLHNRLLQYRYANAKAEVVNEKIANQAESNLFYALDGLSKLQRSVLQKRLQLEKEKHEMKLNLILHSQIKPLEAWGDMERQHLSAVSMTKDYLHSVVCRIPLVEGAKVKQQSASLALGHAVDLALSIKSMLSTFSPEAKKTTLTLSELAKIVAQEKTLLEECMEQLDNILKLEIKERSLRCNIIQLRLWQQQQQQQYYIQV